MMKDNKLLKIRTVEDLSVLLGGIGALVLLSSITALFYVKSIGGAVLIISLPIAFGIGAYLVILKVKNALIVNVVDYDGIRNEWLGETLCSLEWKEIGDFGVVTVDHGVFRGKYIYMSRIFVSSVIKRDIVKKYDPRICVLIPYSKRTCLAVREASGEKIDIA